MLKICLKYNVNSVNIGERYYHNQQHRKSTLYIMLS